MAKRLFVEASYEATKDGSITTGKVEFIARVTNLNKGTDVDSRAQCAAARRLAVPLRDVKITGVMST